MTNQPLISCICVTYGRVAYLEEAVAGFLAQDYPNKQLIILNTFPRQIITDGPPFRLCVDGIDIINCKDRPDSLGKARNYAIAASKGDIIVILDDDDIALKHHLSTIAAAYTDGIDWVHLTKQFYSLGGKIVSVNAGSCPLFTFTKKAWREVNGYPELTVGEDRQLISRITERFKGKRVEPAEPTFVYCWGNGTFHVSGEGDDAPNKLPAHQRIALDLDRRVRAGTEPTGNIVLKPQFRRDWEGMAAAFLASGRSVPKPTKDSVCIVELGRYGDCVNVLPIALHIANNYTKPHWMISRQFADLLDGVSYVEPYIVDLANDQVSEAISLAKRNFKHVIQAQIWGKPPYFQQKVTPAYNLESWNNAGFGHKFWDKTWIPVFDRRNREREQALITKLSTDKPMLLANVTHSVSSPFPSGARLMDSIKQAYGARYNVIDIGQLRLERIYDLIGLIEAAQAMVSIDSAPIHLAAATTTPVVCIVNDKEWLGTMPRCNATSVIKYNDAITHPELVLSGLTVALGLDHINLFLTEHYVRQAPQRVIVHATERHEEKDLKDRRRKHEAWTSWDALYSQSGVIPAHYSNYVRNAFDIGDYRPLPYLKDVLSHAMQFAGDQDIIAFTNDDNWLHPQLPDLLRYHVSIYGACSSQRCEFHKPVPPGPGTPEQYARISNTHMGRDLFAFTKEWLLQKWDEIPDFILGASDWDLCLAAMIRLEKGIPTTRLNLEEVIWPAEIPRGYICHEFHPPRWREPKNEYSAPSQVHNRKIWRQWAEKHVPNLKFKEGNVI